MLRRLGRPSSRPGWCGHAWPNLRSVTGIASGSFASSVPLVCLSSAYPVRLLSLFLLRHNGSLVPNTDIRARGYGSTEVWIGSPYNPVELNQFKPSSKNIIEFLDISKSDSISALTQLVGTPSGARFLADQYRSGRLN